MSKPRSRKLATILTMPDPPEKYDPAAVCVKCRHNVAHTVFKGTIPAVGKGILQRQCIRCGYTWTELPLDAERPNDQTIDEG